MTDIRMNESFQPDQEIQIASDRRMTNIVHQVRHEKPHPQLQPHLSSHTAVTQSSFMPTSTTYNLSNAGHPAACVATVIFKALSLFMYSFQAIFRYLFLSVVVPNVLTFIFVLIISALDFWVVKNVTGRLLVGLRWWSQFDEKGEQIWKFQSFDKQYKSNPVDSAFFWTGQIVTTIVWALFFMLKILSLSLFWVKTLVIQGILTGVNFGLAFLNLYGYYKCRGDYKNKLKTLKSDSLKQLAGKLFF